MPRVTVIVNGAAGGGRAAARAAPALERLRDAGKLDVRRTSGPGHGTELAREAAASGADAVVAAGGDGTLFEVVNGLLPRDGAGPPLGILPVGTGNSFVRDVGLTDVMDAADAVVRGRTRAVDVVRIEDDERILHAINLVSLGFSADAGALVNRRFKGLGIPGYGLAVLATLVSLRSLPVSCQLDDGPPELRDVTLISFCNSRFTGGDMMMAPVADPSDGLLDVIEIGRMGRRRLLTSFPRIFRGTHLAMPEVRTQRARRVAFAPMGTIDAMVDGEVLALELRSLEVVPGALEILA